MPRRRDSESQPIVAPALLLCEGDNDLAFFIRMQGYLGISRSVINVETFDGKDRLAAYLLGLMLRPGISDLSALAIIRDADDDAQSALRNVRSDLDDAGFVLPESSGQFHHGVCRDETSRSVGVFIAPDGMSPGALERLYLQAVGEEPRIDCVRAFMQCVAPHVQHSNVAQRDKAEFHAWLAACERPGILPGQAMDANYIDRNNPAFGPIRDFLTRLAAASEPAPPSA